MYEYIYVIVPAEYLRSSNVCYSLYRVAYIKTTVRKPYMICIT